MIYRHKPFWISYPTLALFIIIILSIGSANSVAQASTSSLLVNMEVASTEAPGSPVIQSDDFAACAMDSDRWTFIDPQGDGAMRLSGGQLELAVPGGASHDIWNGRNDAIRLMQAAGNSDFEIEVKFESGVQDRYAIQGILIEQDDNNYMRFDFYSTATNTVLFAAQFVNNNPTVMYNSTIADGGTAPLYLRVRRIGAEWSQSYSLDGQNWAQGANFDHNLNVSAVGVFAGNAGPSPAHVAAIDYFFNTAVPITPEDGAIPQTALAVISNGNGEILISPEQESYDCGDSVALTAIPDAGWSFSGWTGDLISNNNPAVITMDSDKDVTASFVEQQLPTFGLNVTISGNGTVVRTPDKPAYDIGEVVTLTANPATDWVFDNWSGDASAIEDQISIVMNTDKNISATFVDSGGSDGPTIDVWYGDEQNFGQKGKPQNWLNVLGNVADADGIQALQYSLNGGAPRALAMGPDSRRLGQPGDFNIDIGTSELIAGENQVHITAVDGVSSQSEKTIIVNYYGGNTWPLPDIIDWSTVSNVQDVAQVVDGNWIIDGNGLRPLETGYDRLVAIGDMTWTDYVVTVPIVVHSVDFAAAGGYAPGLGILIRWNGHTDTPVSGYQPKSGWIPHGEIAWWNWFDTNSANLSFFSDSYGQSFTPVIDQPYLFQVRVQTLVDGQSRYYLKVWEEGQPEPENWLLVTDKDSSNLDKGSLLLLAHHVDATFGNVVVSPAVSLTVDKQGLGVVSIEPQKSVYSQGDVVTLTASSANGWHFDGWSGDLVSNSNPLTITLDADTTITVVFEPDDGIGSLNTQSDDFASCELNDGLWTLINPIGDGSIRLSGGQLELFVPDGTSHDVWTSGNDAVQLIQSASNTDFELEVKFESGVEDTYALQGILVQEDDNNFLRFDFFSDGYNTNLFAARFDNGTPTILYNSSISTIGVAPLYLRVLRLGNQWTQSYSLDGQDWVQAASFNDALNVTAAGVFAGNAGSSPVAHNAIIDYFFNTAATISPEDGAVAQSSLNVITTGNGNVSVAPEQASYTCGDSVTLNAIPGNNWIFDGWSGDLIGNENPATVTMDASQSITAGFTEQTISPTYAFSMSVNGNGHVVVDPIKAGYNDGDVVTLTAIADSGWAFENWSGDLAGNENPIAVIMDTNKSITAGFTEQTISPTYALVTYVEGNGSITIDPQKPMYDEGDTVTLTAIPGDGLIFSGWSGDYTGLDNPIAITMDMDKTITAVFETESVGSSISGSIWYDLNDDGIFDLADGDVLLSDRIVILLNLGSDNELTTGDVVVETTVSEANGTYTFVDLPAGNYLVAMVTDGPISASSILGMNGMNGDAMAGVVLGIGEQRTAVNLAVTNKDTDRDGINIFVPFIQR